MKKKLLFSLLCLLSEIVFCDLPCLPRPGAPGEGAVCVCNALHCDSIERPSRLPRGSYFRYTTSHVRPGFSRSRGYFSWNTPEDEPDIVFKINISMQYQEIYGFGGSFTDSAGLLISRLPEEAQNKLIESYFGPTGIEYNLCRMPIGGSDFSPRMYTLDDVPDDVDLRHMTLAEEDYMFKIPLIKKAMSVSDRPILLIACAWTAPQWMKTKNYHYPNDLSGYLRFKYFKTWAEYHVRFIKAYKENGINIWAITGSNQPIFSLRSGISINNTIGLAHQQRFWVKRHLMPRLKNENLSDVKFFTFEENRNYVLYWINRFASDPDAFKLVDGVALHWYTDYWDGNPQILDIIHRKYPEKTILYTESSVNVAFGPTSEAVKLGSWNRAALYIYDIIENVNHWVSGFTDWNLALDPNGGPTLSSYPVDAAVIINTTSGEFYKQPIFYALGHFSKFIPPRSRRVDVQSEPIVHGPPLGRTYPVEAPAAVSCLATGNADGSYTIIVLNNKNMTTRVRLEIAKLGSATVELESHSINTIVYWL